MMNSWSMVAPIVVVSIGCWEKFSKHKNYDGIWVDFLKRKEKGKMCWVDSVGTDKRMRSLMSVVVQDLHIEVWCARSRLQHSSVKMGSYQSTLTNDFYNDPITKMKGLDVTSEVKIERANVARDQGVSTEVDRQMNRL
ncbi:hypothetical protein MTR_8g085360 [Medicago truncatula]|uniref:Uncharacterized protein n=1 Tax=Medicago truncatula TaxID=3880 RepID=G7LHV9_MEDTR|nr:hypothetical protein MTR_8g085360 [Medicago truncatula]